MKHAKEESPEAILKAMIQRLHDENEALQKLISNLEKQSFDHKKTKAKN
jgi:hypothetical protein